MYFLIILLIIILGTLLLIIAEIVYRNTEPTNLSTNNPNYVGASCIDTQGNVLDCGNNLICDSASNFTCKLVPGQPCSNGFDCTSDHYCSGICTSGVFDDFNSNCPCDINLECVTVGTNGQKLCKGGIDFFCSTNDDCATQNCLNGVCSTLNLGQACNINEDCTSGNCNAGFCQNPGISTGSVGSACFNPNCNTGNVNLKCESGLDCVCGNANNGTCVLFEQEIGQICNINTPCQSALVCLNDQANSCSESDDFCSCNFPYPNPFANLVCVNSMTSVNGICLNNNGIGCAINSNCVSGNCGNNSSFVEYDLSTSSLNPITAINIPTGVSKLFIGAGFACAVNSEGIFLLSGSAWLQVYSNNNVIDADYNNGIWVVVLLQGSLYVIFTGNNLNNLLPLNRSDGVPLTNGGDPITVRGISVNDQLNYLITDLNGTLWILTNSFTGNLPWLNVLQVGGPDNGQLISNVIEIAKFYFNGPPEPFGQNVPANNIVYVKSNGILQFSGNPLAGTSIGQGPQIKIDSFPQDITYNIFNFVLESDGISMNETIIATLANSPFGTVLTAGILTTANILPFNTNNSSKCLSLAGKYYIWSPGTCLNVN